MEEAAGLDAAWPWSYVFPATLPVVLLSDPEKRRLMYSDLLANNLSILVTSPIIKRVVVSDAGPVRDFATRTTTDYLSGRRKYVVRRICGGG